MHYCSHMGGYSSFSSVSSTAAWYAFVEINGAE